MEEEPAAEDGDEAVAVDDSFALSVHPVREIASATTSAAAGVVKRCRRLDPGIVQEFFERGDPPSALRAVTKRRSERRLTTRTA